MPNSKEKVTPSFQKIDIIMANLATTILCPETLWLTM